MEIANIEIKGLAVLGFISDAYNEFVSRKKLSKKSVKQ